MSQNAVETVLEFIRLFGEGDLAAMAALWDEHAVVIPPEGWPEAGPFVGRKAVMANWAQIREDWVEQTMTSRSVRAQGDIVVARTLWSVQGRRSGIATELDTTGVYRLRDGLIAEARFYFDWAGALEAAGLSE